MATTRRTFVLGSAGLAALPMAVRSLSAHAAPPNRIVRVGMLTSGMPIRWDMVETATAAGLRDLGYVEGKNLELIRRSATYPDKKMEAHTRELIDDDLYFEYLAHIFPVSAELRVPTFFTKRDLVDVGGVFSYGVDSVALFRRSAYFIDRLVNGLRPSECPVENPTKLEFAINLKKANKFGIDVPRAALLRADYVVK